MALETVVETHGENATACAFCEEPSEELRRARSNETLADLHLGTDFCARFCPDCLDNDDDLACVECGPVCGRHERSKEYVYADGDVSLWSCDGCNGDDYEEDERRRDGEEALTERIADLERVGIPARRRVEALLTFLEASTEEDEVAP